MAKTNESTMKYKLDIAELKSGLQQAKTAIAQANSEFAKSTEGLDNWRKSSEGVEAKLKQLRSTLTAQNQVLSNYRDQLARTEEEYGENSIQAEQLREKIEKQKSTISRTKNEINKYESSLSNLEKAQALAEKEGISLDEALKKLKRSANQADDSMEDLGKSTKDTESGFTVAKGAIAGFIANAITGFISSVGQAIEESREFRNELAMLEATAQTTGGSFETAKQNLKDIATITGDTGAGVEAVNNLMSAGFKSDALDQITDQLLGASIKWKDTLKMEGLADGLQETLATGSAIGPFAEMLERSGVNLDTFNAGLSKATTEAQKQNYVLQELEKLGLTKTLDAYRENNKYMLMNAEASYKMQENMAQFGAKVEPVIASVKMGFADLFSSLLTLGDGINFEAIAGKISAGFGVVKQVLTGQMSPAELIQMGVQWISGLIQGLTQSIPGLITQGVQIASQLITSIGSGLVQGVPSFISKALNLLVSFTGSIRENAPKLIQAGLGMIQNLVQGLMNSLPQLIAKVPIIVSNIANVINDNAPTILKSAVNIIRTIIKGIISAIPDLVANIPKIISAIVDVWSAFNWAQLGKKAFTALKDGIMSIGPKLKESASKIVDTIQGKVKELGPKLVEIGKGGIRSMGQAITNAKNYVVTGAKNIFNAVVNGVKNLPTKLKDIGKDLVRGLWNGISDMTGWVIEKIQGFGDSILSGIKDFFGIHSPSKVMEDEVGKNLALGIASGVDKNSGTALKSIESLATMVMNLLGGITTGEPNEDLVVLKELIVQRVAELITATQESLKGYKQIYENALIELASAVEKQIRKTNDTLIRTAKTTLLVSAPKVGTDLIDGIISGLNRREGALYSRISSIIREAIARAQAEAEIASPSKVMRDLIGVNLIKGVVVGLESEAKNLYGKMRTVIDNTVGVARSNVSQGLSGLRPASGGVVGSGTPTTNNNVVFNQTINSPKALSRTEIYRDTKNLVKLVGGTI